MYMFIYAMRYFYIIYQIKKNYPKNPSVELQTTLSVTLTGLNDLYNLYLIKIHDIIYKNDERKIQ